MLGHDWNEEGQIFLTFAVQDTGRGLSCEEKSRLFHRFSQANPRTHVEYGGSGLGLFISRELTERHGGQIGVKSVLGEGSELGRTSLRGESQLTFSATRHFCILCQSSKN